MQAETENAIDYDFVNPEILHKTNDIAKEEESAKYMENVDIAKKIVKHAEKFLNNRILKIKNYGKILKNREINDSFLYNKVDSIMCLHIIPIIDLYYKPHLKYLDVDYFFNKMKLFESGSMNFRHNIDGIQVYCDEGELLYYTHLFRNFCIESITNHIIFDHSNSPRTHFSGILMSPIHTITLLNNVLNSHIELQNALNAKPPFLVQISFLEMDGVKMNFDFDFSGRVFTCDRKNIHLPPSLISEYHEDKNYKNILKEQMDYLWNVFGLSKCNLIDDQGNPNFRN